MVHGGASVRATLRLPSIRRREYWRPLQENPGGKIREAYLALGRQVWPQINFSMFPFLNLLEATYNVRLRAFDGCCDNKKKAIQRSELRPRRPKSLEGRERGYSTATRGH